VKAIVWTKYGSPDGLELQEVEKPTPKEDEVLVKIHATTAFAGDCEFRSLKFPIPLMGLFMRLYTGLRRPKRITILGQELAGEIEAVGQDVASFEKGDQVFGTTGFGMGAYAEYMCMPGKPKGMAGVLASKPVNMTFEQAAAVPVGGLEALNFLRKGHIQNGEKVLIHGAGGSIGTMAIQLAKHFGAEVTAVDSTAKLDMLRSIGADHVIDYTRQDFAKNGEVYDVIFDVVGKSSFPHSKKSLTQNGRYLLANPGLSHMLRGRRTRSGKKIIFGASSHKTSDLIFLKRLVQEEKLKSVIDRRYPLEQMAEAHRYVETGQKRGSVVIIVEHDDKT